MLGPRGDDVMAAASGGGKGALQREIIRFRMAARTSGAMGVLAL